MKIQFFQEESGEVMLEGMLVTILTIFMLVWILGIGFIYYQRNVATVVTNDAATKIADTYSFPSTDMVIGYLDSMDYISRDLYRYAFFSEVSGPSLLKANETKVQNYIQQRLKETNFAGVVNEVTVELRLVNDSQLRTHVEVESVTTFNTPFGAVLKFFGMSPEFSYKAVGRADCTDKIDYISKVDYQARMMGGKDIHSTGKKALQSWVKLIRKLATIFNHSYDLDPSQG